MIDQSKTYTTRAGESVRILATDGPDVNYPVIALIGHEVRRYRASGEASAGLMCGLAGGRSGYSLIESDPHGILPRNRELLARVLNECDFPQAALDITSSADFGMLGYPWQAALIALARLESSLRSEVGE